MKRHLDINIYGKVQGVFFRQMAMEEAEKLGIVGYADRLQDGSIQIEAEGEEEELKKFLQWCQRGPYLAKIEMIIFVFSDKNGEFAVFEIRKTQSRRPERRIHYFCR